MTVFTVGHSTREIDEFIAILRGHGIRALIDVRRFPGSRRYPWFSRAALEQRLAVEGIEYRHADALGGRRDPRPGSPHTGLRDGQFRGYADHMQTDEFAAALDRLIATASEAPAAIMCAEAEPWRCHRSMIADAIDVRGIAVEHIADEHLRAPHRRTEWARVRDGVLIYAAPQEELPLEPPP